MENDFIPHDAVNLIHHSLYSNKDLEVVKALLPLTGWTTCTLGCTLTFTSAAMENRIDVIKLLAPLVDNPNAIRWNGITPAAWAKKHGNHEAARIFKSYEKQ